jgi:fibronectin type 3 domain-containing protein
MVINRAAPAAPGGFLAGANPLWGSSAVEFEWSPNAERDVVEYRVHRVATGTTPSASDPVACSKSVDDRLPTSCMESSTPAPPAGKEWSYYVVAMAPSRTTAGQLEASARPAAGQTLTPNVAPSPPPSVSISTGAAGVTLSWPAASDSDGSIRFYRIYRDDDTSIDVRYDRTASGGDTSYTDPSGLVGTHRYWVTAVDDRLAESAFAPTGGITP